MKTDASKTEQEAPQTPSTRPIPPSTSTPLAPTNLALAIQAPVSPISPTSPTSNSLEKPPLPLFLNQSTFAKPRRDDVLAHLTLEQKERLDQWLFIDQLKYPQIVALIAEPAPQGFGLNTSPSAVGRYFQKHRIADQITHTAEIAAIVSNPHTTFADFLQQVALYAASNPEFDPRVFNSLTRFHRAQLDNQHRAKTETQRDRHLDLIAQRLHLETFKAQFNAARQALEHAAQLQAILADPTIDNEEKINQARPILFGPSTVPASQYEVFPSPGDLSPSPIKNHQSSIINAQ